MIGKAADDLDHHEKGGDDGGPFGAGFRAGMTFAQENMIARPHAMIMRRGGVIMVMVMPVIVIMGVPMCMQGVIVRHDLSLARSARKIWRKML